MESKHYIITGASGFLGWSLLQELPQEAEATALYHSTNPANSRAQARKIQLSDEKEVYSMVKKVSPQAIIHAAALSDPNACQNNKEISQRINVQSSELLAKICADHDITFAFTSTDLVFDGKKSLYGEHDTTNPLSLYGEQKVQAEEAILKAYPEASVFRLPLMFGESQGRCKNGLYEMLHQLKTGNELTLFSDEFRSMARARTIAKAIYQLTGKLSGITHLGGKERISRYEYGEKVQKIFNFKEGNIRKCLRADIKMSAPRPADVSLDSSRALEAGYESKSVSEELKEIYQFIGPLAGQAPQEQ
ncbi:MAG: NAD(P)-dependent oxidoreductase [Planctomycetes bacterium]|nr:NAD(P)-dependent oxidoreductase [Planctomycetota bacterium]